MKRGTELGLTSGWVGVTRDFGDESRIRPTKAFGSVRCNPKLIGSSWVDFVGSAEWVGGPVYSIRRFRVTVLDINMLT